MILFICLVICSPKQAPSTFLIILIKVGYVNDPWQVRVELLEFVGMDDKEVTLDGQTSVDFKAGSGYATFDNLVINGVRIVSKGTNF